MWSTSTSIPRSATGTRTLAAAWGLPSVHRGQGEAMALRPGRRARSSAAQGLRVDAMPVPRPRGLPLVGTTLASVHQGRGEATALRPGHRQHSSAAHGLRVDAMPVPRPRGLPLVGTTLALLWAGGATRLHEYVDARHRQLGPIFRDRIGPVDIVFISDPALMRRTFGLEGKYPMHFLPEAWTLYNELYGNKRGLFFMDGEEWLRTRRLLNPLLLKPEQGDVFSAPCQRVAESLVSKWKSANVTTVKGLEAQLYKWSLDTVIAIMMGSQYEAHAGRWDADVQHLARNIHNIFLESGRMSLIQPKYARACHLPVWKRFVSIVDASLSTTRSLLLKMIPLCSTSSDGLLSAMINSGMCEEDIVKVVVDFIIAAGDTTALSMQWTLYLLAKNYHTQTRVAAEVIREKNVLQSALLRGVVREALRLYPVAPFLTRIIPEPCTLAGYELHAKELVILSLYTSGRDGENFPKPDVFWPERWLRDSDAACELSKGSYQAVINPNASMPFAIGARSCIGRKLAETQMIITLATILREFKLELINKENIEMVLRLVAVPSKPIQICLTPREKDN